jgi:hypothetical protein
MVWFAYPSWYAHLSFPTNPSSPMITACSGWWSVRVRGCRWTMDACSYSGNDCMTFIWDSISVRADSTFSLQLMSVISLLSSETPNTDSPANVDAAKEVRTEWAGMWLPIGSNNHSILNGTLQRTRRRYGVWYARVQRRPLISTFAVYVVVSILLVVVYWSSS